MKRASVRPRRDGRGFTLIEMLVVVTILAVLVGTAVPMAEIAARRAQERSLREGLRTLRSALDAHRSAVEAKQVAPSAPGSPWPASLALLVEGVPLLDEEGRPRGDAARMYFLRRMPRDPHADPALPAELTWGLRASTSGPAPPRAGADVFDVYSTSDRTALDGSRISQW